MRADGEKSVLPDEVAVDSFTEWFRDAEPRLRNALTASFGFQVGKEAAADALSHAWVHWDLVRAKPNPLGYVYGVGRNKGRRMAALRRPVFLDVPVQRLPHVEPRLPAAIAALPEKQRTVVTLVYAYEWTFSEVAELMGTAKTTVQNHAERGVKKLRRTLGVEL
jgi:DNA-directed RNA polymerase specialized sigma24 family protein